MLEVGFNLQAASCDCKPNYPMLIQKLVRMTLDTSRKNPLDSDLDAPHSSPGPIIKPETFARRQCRNSNRAASFSLWGSGFGIWGFGVSQFWMWGSFIVPEYSTAKHRL